MDCPTHHDLHTIDVSLILLPISKSAAKLTACKLQTVWKCSCINSFPGQCPYKMKTRKYMSIIQRITWLLWNNLLYGFHSLSHIFFPLSRSCSFFLDLLAVQNTGLIIFLAFERENHQGRLAEVKWMEIMGYIQGFRKAEIHKHRVNLYVLFDVIVMPESAWSNQPVPGSGEQMFSYSYLPMSTCIKNL